MLPVTHGLAYTRLQVLLYTVLLTLVTLLPYLTRMSGLFTWSPPSVSMPAFSTTRSRSRSRRATELPMRVFRFSVTYLMWLFAALLVDHYLPAFRGLV